MGVMFDIKILDYTQVLNSRTDLSITKDKDKEQRKRRQKKSNTGSNQIRKKDKKYPFKKLNLLDLTV
jgi:predicted RNA-binding protein with RPS1 domain